MLRAIPLVILLAVPLSAQEPAKIIKDLEGKYTLISMTMGGKSMMRPEKDRESFEIKGGQLIAISPDGKRRDPIVIRVSVDPPVIDFVEPGRAGGPHMLGVYQIDGKKLTLCFVESNKPTDRPKDVKATGEKIAVMVLEKVVEVKDKK